jgi:hypothetical protein
MRSGGSPLKRVVHDLRPLQKPSAHKQSSEDHPLRTARGLLMALLISAVLWMLLLSVVWAL